MYTFPINHISHFSCVYFSYLFPGARSHTTSTVLNIIKLATMDKMKEAEGAGGVGGGGTAGGGGGGTTEGGDAFHSEFYNTGRIGRRNALPDILGSHCTTTTADLPTQLGALSTSGKLDALVSCGVRAGIQPILEFQFIVKRSLDVKTYSYYNSS